ncbi:MAG: nicotinate-nucleotide--dimethylbenzimidazole phosphoribosyltransferase [Spirochaetales bacterium]|nr:nicotinate-nucleotide--dimethylbenzimidazole phosphoribosyltransferase [Spirochaetales bacterium]
MDSIKEKMQQHLDNLTKPIGSLGRLEELSLKLAEIQGKAPPRLEKKACYVFAGDHGINAEGVSMYPQEVTEQMLRNLINGGAGINVLAKHCGFDVFNVDTGIAVDTNSETVIKCRAGNGTNNFLKEEAMSQSQLEKCIENGKKLAEQAYNDGYQLVALGDLGISNTTTAAAMVIAGGLDFDSIVDKGTGITDDMLLTKKRVIKDSVKRHSPFSDPMDVMRKVGGFEQCTMAGFILGLREKGIGCIIDGFPVTAGTYMAWLIDNSVTDFLFAGHRSKVKGHDIILKKMGLKPIADLDMRLGEGTGAVIGGFMIELGVRIAQEMASFESANVSESIAEEDNY